MKDTDNKMLAGIVAAVALTLLFLFGLYRANFSPKPMPDPPVDSAATQAQGGDTGALGSGSYTRGRSASGPTADR